MLRQLPKAVNYLKKAGKHQEKVGLRLGRTKEL